MQESYGYKVGSYGRADTAEHDHASMEDISFWMEFVSVRKLELYTSGKEP